jgi:predicted transcriptional regulator
MAEKNERLLTRGELQVMNILWEHRHATVAEVVEAFPEPRPAYNTVLTFLRIMEEKGFVGHKKSGRLYVYHPIVQKGEYTRIYLKGVRDQLFDGSAKSLISFFAEEESLTAGEVQELIDLLRTLPTSE